MKYATNEEWTEVMQDFDGLMPMEFIDKYAKKHKGITIEIYGSYHTAKSGMFKVFFRPFFSSFDRNKTHLCASNILGEVPASEIRDLLSAAQYAALLKGEYQFFIPEPKEEKEEFTDDECKVPILNGEQFLIFPSALQNPIGVNYIRFEDKQGRELLYYDIQEWIDDPEAVMGAIMAAIQNGADIQQ